MIVGEGCGMETPAFCFCLLCKYEIFSLTSFLLAVFLKLSWHIYSQHLYMIVKMYFFFFGGGGHQVHKFPFLVIFSPKYRLPCETVEHLWGNEGFALLPLEQHFITNISLRILNTKRGRGTKRIKAPLPPKKDTKREGWGLLKGHWTVDFGYPFFTKNITHTRT